MLEALSSRSVWDPDDPDAAFDPSKHVDCGWIRHVRGFMTLGSPIDKHIILWPKLWTGFDLESHLSQQGEVVFDGQAVQPRLKLKAPIKWRNYYDFGDPVGFKLDTAEEFLADHHCNAFEFETSKLGVKSQHDFGFSRYLLPGKAHVDYWHDQEVFSHFFNDVVLRNGEAKPPRSKFLFDKISMAIPYSLAILCHVAAVFLLYKGFIELRRLDVKALDLAQQIGVFSALLLGITIAARLPRLVKTANIRWHVVSLLVFIACAGPFYWYPSDIVAKLVWEPAIVGKQIIIGGAALIALTGWLVPRRPRWGRRVLVVTGTVAVVSVIVAEAVRQSAVSEFWPAALASVGFLYVWWLGICLFDLTFLWHRYIRRSVAVKTLRNWKNRQEAVPEATQAFKACACRLRKSLGVRGSASQHPHAR